MNWWIKTKEFLSEVRTEMRKVSFPTRDEVVATTVVVLITSVVFAAFLFLADRLIIWGYQGVVRMFG
jgi:preprotein translocase subunit SecE